MWEIPVFHNVEFEDIAPCTLVEVDQRSEMITAYHPDDGSSKHLWYFDLFPRDYTA
jgi:hypothetical protein